MPLPILSDFFNDILLKTANKASLIELYLQDSQLNDFHVAWICRVEGPEIDISIVLATVKDLRIKGLY